MLHYTRGALPLMLTQSDHWQRLNANAAALKSTTQYALHQQDPQRATRYCLQDGPLALDYSRQLVTDETLALLADLVRVSETEAWLQRMVRGEHVNNTEDRPALHTLLRGTGTSHQPELTKTVSAGLSRWLAFAEDVRSGRWRGATGEHITDVLAIGIGGSYLGPETVCNAIAATADGPRVHFVPNIDPAAFALAARELAPAHTLVILSSKSFGTEETLVIGRVAANWLSNALGARGQSHMVACTSNVQAAVSFGVAKEQVFALWPWVGGRFSLWSAIGLPIALRNGERAFRELLAGAARADQHMLETPLTRSIPGMLAQLSVWNGSVLGTSVHAIIPYSQALARLPAHLQQLHMESNGKRVDRTGQPTRQPSVACIMGEPGTCAQHSIFQWMHQGTHAFTATLIGVRDSGLVEDWAQDAHHRLVTHLRAQSEVLAFGGDMDDAQRGIPGNRPHSVLMLDKVNAFNVGYLIATFEHVAAAEGFLCGVNPFDQWGVELGKQIARKLLASESGALHTASR